MRPLYADISGTTDASGNASIPVALGRMTGNWHNAKFAVGTTAQAEWAVLVNGRPYTYGRGRRVTLGPELIQDGQTATISVIGGPANAAIDGTVTGVSGAPDEVMAAYTPSPNTIALDAFNGSRLIGTINNVGGGDTVGPKTLQIPAGSQGIGFAVSGVAPNQTPGSVAIRGTQTNLPYITLSTNPVAWATELFPEDTSVTVTVVGNAGANPSVTFIHAYTYNPRTRVQGSSPNVALPWQAANALADVTATTNTTTPLVAPSGSLHVFMFGWSMAMDGSASGVLARIVEHVSASTIATLSTNGTAGGLASVQGNEGGADLGASSGLDLVTDSVPAGGRVRATARVSQG